MKKLILIMICVLLMALFIAFNYLLWDREGKIRELESLQNIRVTNGANINSLNRDIKNLEDERDKLQTNIAELGDDKEQLIQKNTQLENEKVQIEQKISEKIDMINILKANVDMKVFDEPIVKWVEAVDTGRYEDAYGMEFAKTTLQESAYSLDEYSDLLKRTVKNIKFKEAKVDSELGKTEGEIYVIATLEVKVPEGTDLSDARFIDGLNEVSFSIDYDYINRNFYISSLSIIKK